MPTAKQNKTADFGEILAALDQSAPGKALRRDSARPTGPETKVESGVAAPNAAKTALPEVAKTENEAIAAELGLSPNLGTVDLQRIRRPSRPIRTGAAHWRGAAHIYCQYAD
jgi:hypothetical protein